MEKFRDRWVGAVFVIALLVPVYFLVAALGTKFHLFPWTVGFGLMTYMAARPLLLGVAALAVIALLLALFVKPRRGIPAALVSLLIPVLGMGYGYYVGQRAAGVPPIHDISTDLVDPPGFSAAVVSARAAVPLGNDLDLLHKQTGDGRSFISLQQQAYPDIQPIESRLPPARAFAIALALVREQNWRIGRVDEQGGVIEATAESFWYGFIDDIAIRVRPDGEGSRIDMRSVSRVGRSDLGANAARMGPFLAELRARVQSAEATP